MEIPANRVGLSEGLWLRWPELQEFLEARGDTELASEIEEMVLGPAVSQREVTVRGKALRG
jgi:hypothetical protein